MTEEETGSPHSAIGDTAAVIAEALLSRYGEDALRVASIQLDAADDDGRSTWAAVVLRLS